MVSTRDRIWETTLRLLDFNRTITVSDVTDSIETDPPTNRTVRDTLASMESLGLLGSEGGHGSAPKEYFALKPGTSVDTPGYTPRAGTSDSPIPYPGGKSHIADWIIDIMPSHDTFVEVCGGSGGVLFNKPASKYEIYNDTDNDLTQFFRVLRDRPEDLISWLMAVPYSRTQYQHWVEEYYEGYRPEDPVERAGRFFSLRYMQYLGVSSGPNGFKARARRSPARSFDNGRRRLESFADRLRQVTIENRDYQEILTDYDDPAIDVVFYIDPPYRESDTHYDQEISHQELAESLQSVDNDWILSCSEIPAGLGDYWTLEQESRHQMKRSAGDVSERLVCNFDPDARTSFRSSIGD